MKRVKPIFKPAQILTLGFFLIILIGAGLLLLPVSVNPGQPPLSLIDALFTATSSVCITGLTVVNTGVYYSFFGELVIILLIQIGGLGFMTVAALLFRSIRKKATLKERILLQEAFSSDSLRGLSSLVGNAVLVTAVFEGVGACLLMLRFIPQYGTTDGIFYSIFIAISAFCNAGFDPLGMENSLVAYQTDSFVLIVIMLLIIAGGLGFSVVLELSSHHTRFGKPLSLHTRLVLLITGILIVGGTLLFLLTEWNNPQVLNNPNLTFGKKLLLSFFESVTLRTAGFDSIGQNLLSPAGTAVAMLLMFIGASPASTGGGIKTTTFFVILLAVHTVIHQREDYNIGKRRLALSVIRKAQAVFFLALGLVAGGSFLIAVIQELTGQPFSLTDIVFESISACATVGVSRGITASLNQLSKLVLIVTMFFGRVGPMTISIALSGDAGKVNAVRYPEDRVLIG